MDLKKLALLVSQCQPLWDRTQYKFRDQEFKAALWKKIGIELNTTDIACKEAFKSLREKYIREREKLQQCGDYSKQWELLGYLQFLDQHITRKSYYTPAQGFEEHVAIKQDPISDTECNFQEEMDGNNDNSTLNSTKHFCKSLIKFVYESRALWDRNYKDYNDKQLKEHLWMGIANALKSDVTSCSLKWKSLREKYIRQKQKYAEGDNKWEFLDGLSFLDSVILYRKKHWIPEEANYPYSNNNSCALSQSNFDYELTDEATDDSIPNQLLTSTQNQTTSSPLLSHIPDSTLEIINNTKRKRSSSMNSEASNYNAKRCCVNQERTPEQIYGEFVAAMLAARPDNEKKLAMMEIMAILTKPNM